MLNNMPTFISTLMKKHSLLWVSFWGVGRPSRHISFLFPGHDSGPSPVSYGSVQQVLHLTHFYLCFRNFYTPFTFALPFDFYVSLNDSFDPYKQSVKHVCKLFANLCHTIFFQLLSTCLSTVCIHIKRPLGGEYESRLVLNAGADDSAA